MVGNWLYMQALSRAASTLEDTLRSLGIEEIRWHREVPSYVQALRDTDKGGTGEYFKEELNILPPKRFFGITGHDADGETICSTANRFDDVEGWDLKTYIQKFWGRNYVGEEDETLARMTSEGLFFLEGLKGPFAYIGDTWVDDRLAGGNRAAYLVRLCILYCYMEWRPGYIYGWMAPHHAARGLGFRWGFPVVWPGGFIWQTPPKKQVYADLCFLGCPVPAVETIARRPLDIGLVQVRTKSKT
ncbi:hypothetical protein DYI23_05930 [Roseibium polysiphoniae]|uniref:Uncharacterized protein n=1 Tax=Roseibium polysiphoniae TaxID=2571221 RepID=A0A944CB12_9HYPH|nr:hypothetical protein [Roseibium polysiphoniae]MBS8259753.1 hypothetical protein [Roseibium polysiphoniae]